MSVFAWGAEFLSFFIDRTYSHSTQKSNGKKNQKRAQKCIWNHLPCANHAQIYQDTINIIMENGTENDQAHQYMSVYVSIYCV